MLTPYTFAWPPVAILSSSPRVVESMRWGDIWPEDPNTRSIGVNAFIVHPFDRGVRGAVHA